MTTSMRACFGPEQIRRLQEAMTIAWNATRRDFEEAGSLDERTVREFIASEIMNAAARGETDPARLADHAIEAAAALRRQEKEREPCGADERRPTKPES